MFILILHGASLQYLLQYFIMLQFSGRSAGILILAGAAAVAPQVNIVLLLAHAQI